MALNSEWLQLELYESTNSVRYIFALRTTNGIVGSNPNWNMDICVLSGFVLFCVSTALRWGDPPFKESYQMFKNKTLQSRKQETLGHTCL
jgi:hypothetical protein